jgi:hypothetical protein
MVKLNSFQMEKTQGGFWLVAFILGFMVGAIIAVIVTENNS